MLAAAILAAAATTAVAPDLTRPAAATTQTFGVGTHSFVVPAGVAQVTATVTGARGGSQSGIGGGGAVVPATAIPVTPGETLTIHVGSFGGNGASIQTAGVGGTSGFAAGASGGRGGIVFPVTGGGGGGGGGASAVVQAGTPRIVAGGGGGGAGHGRTAFDDLAGGNGGNAGVNGSQASTQLAGAGGSCCSTTSRNGGVGQSGGGTALQPTANGGGGGGGGGYDGGTNGGGLGGATGDRQVVPAIGGAGGGGAGGRSWVLGSRYAPTSFNTGNINGGNGQVVLTFTASTTTTLVSSVNPTFEGQSVTFTASVAAGAGTPTGTATFFDGGTQIGGPVTLVNGVATFATSGLSAGNHSITAVYNGSTDFTTSTSNVVVRTVIAPVGGLQLVASANPVTVDATGDTITYTATVTNTGNVAINGVGVADAPVAPAGPVPSIACTPATIPAAGTATCTGTYTVTTADVAGASAEVFRTFTATGTNAVSGAAVGSNPFAVSVDVRAPLPGWVSLLVNTSNTVGLTP